MGESPLPPKEWAKEASPPPPSPLVTLAMNDAGGRKRGGDYPGGRCRRARGECGGASEEQQRHGVCQTPAASRQTGAEPVVTSPTRCHDWRIVLFVCLLFIVMFSIYFNEESNESAVLGISLLY